MQQLKRYKISIPTLVFSVFFAFTIFMIGCSSDSTNPVTPPVTVDTNVIVYDSIDVFEFFNATSSNGVNLLSGRTTITSDTEKDMTLNDSNGLGVNFFLRSGDRSLLDNVMAGKKTRFNRIYTNMTKANFDTVSVIPDSDNQLNELDFTSDDTYSNGSWGYFKSGLVNDNRVYSFYLIGKFQGGVTSKPVYGIFRLNNTVQSGITGLKLNISVRINKDGQNHMKR
jgi:hypothetical protein